MTLIVSRLMAASERKLDQVLESVSGDQPAILWEDLDAQTRSGLERGIADADAGRISSVEDVFERLYAKADPTGSLGAKRA